MTGQARFCVIVVGVVWRLLLAKLFWVEPDSLLVKSASVFVLFVEASSLCLVGYGSVLVEGASLLVLLVQATS
jgi:hypothetical protein